jgi:hypothetical protein
LCIMRDEEKGAWGNTSKENKILLMQKEAPHSQLHSKGKSTGPGEKRKNTLLIKISQWTKNMLNL